MFNAITLENFKGFGQRQRIELAPLTLIYGQNSAGKSSILQAISLMQQTRANREQNAVLLPRAHAGNVNLGSFRDMVFEHDEANQLCIGFEIAEPNDYSKSGIINLYFKYGEQNKKIELSRLDIGTSQWNGEVPTYEPTTLTQKERRLFFRYRRHISRDQGQAFSDTHYLKPSQLSEEADIWNKYYKTAKSNKDVICKSLRQLLDLPLKEWPHATKQAIKNAIDFYSSDFSQKMFIKRLIQNEQKTKVLMSGCLPYYESRQYFRQAYPYKNPEFHAIDRFARGNRELFPSDIAHECADEAASVGNLFDDYLNKVVHLGPFRQEPDRFYVRSATTPNDVGYKGENFPSLVGDHQSSLAEVNQWLDRLETGYQIELEDLSQESELFTIRLIDLRHGKRLRVGLTDVGFGISQVIPIIVQALFSQRKIILIEQPEVHVHPRLQADIADLFVESANRYGSKKNQLVIETHSEHLMLRIQKLIHEERISSQDVSVIWVGRDTEGSTAQRLRVDENGDFIDPWPDGFFPERMREFF